MSHFYVYACVLPAMLTFKTPHTATSGGGAAAASAHAARSEL